MDNKKRGTVAGGLFWAFSERITAQLVSLTVSIILARLLDPEHYATIAVVSIFITIANTFVTSGFGNSLIQKKEADSLDFSTTLFFSFSLSVLLYFVLFACSPWIASFYNRPELTAILRVMSLRIIVASINSIQHAYVSKQMAFRKFFFSTLFGTIVSAVVGIVLAYKGYGVWALVAQYLTNTTIDTIVLSFTCGWKPTLQFSFARMKRLYSYGWKLLVSDLLGTLYEQLRALVLSKGFQPTELSYYNQGEKYPALFMHNVEASMHKVLFQTLSENQDDVLKVKDITRRTIQITILLLSPIFFGLAACGNSLISLLLTDKWLPCVPYLRIVCFLYLIHPIFSAHTRVLKALGKSGVFMALTTFRYCLGIGLLVASMLFFKEPHVVISSSVVTMLVITIICDVITNKEIDYKINEQIADVFPPILCGAIMCFAVVIVGKTVSDKLLALVIQVFVGMVSYVVLSMIFNKQIFAAALKMAKQKLKRKAVK